MSQSEIQKLKSQIVCYCIVCGGQKYLIITFNIDNKELK